MTRPAPIARIPLRRLAPWPLPPQQAREAELPPGWSLCSECGALLRAAAAWCVNCERRRCEP